MDDAPECVCGGAGGLRSGGGQEHHSGQQWEGFLSGAQGTWRLALAHFPPEEDSLI